MLVVSAWVFVGVHAILAPLVLPFRSANPLGPRWVESRLYVHTPLSPAAAEQTLVIVNAPSPVHGNYLLFLQDLSGGPVPRHIRARAEDRMQRPMPGRILHDELRRLVIRHVIVAAAAGAFADRNPVGVTRPFE